MTTPEWAAQHDGEVRISKDRQSMVLFLTGEPQYLLLLTPVKGQFGCRVSQTVNGKRLDSGAPFPTEQAAFQGGLEDLRKALGW
jgi:hypothetical protein